MDPEIKAGTAAYDTGKKFIDSNGVPRIVYRKVLDVGALPNADGKNVAHGEADIDLTAGAYVKAEIIGSNGTASIPKTDPELSVTDTNLVVTATADLSDYEGIGIIEFIKTLD